MEVDDLHWLCAELALPVLEETEHGVLANAPARAAVTPGASLSDACAAILGVTTLPGALDTAISGARRGARERVSLDDAAPPRLVLVTPSAPGLVRVTFAAPATQSRALIDVAAAVSHEVANAVGTIRGWADLALHDGAATVDVRDALTLIRGAARSAEQAARSMLALARGEATIHDDAGSDLSEIASELLQLLTLTAREQRVTLKSEIAPQLAVQASRAQLFTILFNLVKNAIEACAPSGLVSVRAEGDEREVRLLVHDTGAGIEPSAQEQLFRRFYTTKTTGTGLGLSLVRDAVNASGARIEVESAAGRGALFRVTFPRLRAGAVPDASRIEPIAVQDAPPMLSARLLVVDDDHALGELLATALSLRGADVVSVRSAEEARGLSGPFDLALIDMMLDGCRGDELLALLRQRDIVQAAILVTGTVQRPRLVPGGEPDDWVRKPFDIPQLVDRIRRTLERHRMLHDASSAARF